jgi:DNA-binding transcriptional LysR family regulator
MAKSYNNFMHIDGRRLHYFITVADQGSLGRAAEVLHIAQPALTRQIRLLEDAVGTELMKRTTRGMVLTAAGQVYYSSARRLIDDAAAANKQAIRTARGDRGLLRIGFSEIYAWHPEVLEALRTYRSESPDVTFTVEATLSGVVTQRVIEGHLDLALAYIGELSEDSPLGSRHWMTDTYLLAVHEASPLAKKPPKKLLELAGEDFVFFRRNQSPLLYDLMIHHFRERNFSPHITQEATSHNTALGMTAAGLGCTVIPRSVAQQRLPQGVCLVSIPDLNVRMPVNLIWRRDQDTPVVQRFADLLCGSGKLRGRTSKVAQVIRRS